MSMGLRTCAFVCLWLASLAGRSPAEVEAIRRDVALTPSPATVNEYFGSLLKLPRRIRIAAPCIGINGCGHAFRQMGVPAEYVHAYDLEAGYSHYLEQFFESIGMEFISMNVGKSAGDLLKVPLRTIREYGRGLPHRGPTMPTMVCTRQPSRHKG